MGRLRNFPRMSQSAISIPLTTCVVAPLEPMYVKARKILFQIRSIWEGSSPMRRSLSFSTMPATARLAVRVVVVISPHPVMPSSVCTSIKKYSPQVVPSTFTSHGLIDVIFKGVICSGRAFALGRGYNLVRSRSSSDDSALRRNSPTLSLPSGRG
jgi:hypothetical protein